MYRYAIEHLKKEFKITAQLISHLEEPSLIENLTREVGLLYRDFLKTTSNLTELHLSDETILQPQNPLVIPHRIFTAYELSHFYNGEDHQPAYVAVNGFVFDMTHHLLWESGLIKAGQDLTSYFTRYYTDNPSELAKEVPLLGRFLTGSTF